MPKQPKPHWGQDAEEFNHECPCSVEQLREIMLWMNKHGVYTAPTPETLIVLMDVADAEQAPHHIRHFLWSYLWYPEDTRFIDQA